MDIGGKVLTSLVELLVNQEQTWANEASTLQVQAHQSSGKSAACKAIKEAVIKLVAEMESQALKAQVIEKVEEPTATVLSQEVKNRISAGECIHRARLETGSYEWCSNKKTKRTDYCRKHNKELGLTNVKKPNTGRSS